MAGHTTHVTQGTHPTVALIIIFSKSRWLVIGSWAVAALAVIGLFAYHANDVLELSF